jgi:putative long chain acyl-CoA synthase
MGRPLPGSAEVRIAAYDPQTDKYELGEDGFARECGPGETGMLLARTRVRDVTGGSALRGMFDRGDAWIETGDLFRRDGDGDYWRIDNVSDVIYTAGGPAYRGPIRNALGSLPAVDLAVAYGVTPDGGEHELAVAAVTLQDGHELDPRDLDAAFSGISPPQRPAIVHVVSEIPVTTWYRPLTGPLRSAGLPKPADQVYYRDDRAGGYTELSEPAYERLSGRQPQQEAV